jgi:thymidylate synthase (FAD)
MKISNMSVELINYMGDDIAIVNAARVSFSKESKWEENTTTYYTATAVGNLIPHTYVTKELSAADQKLIAYLATHGHWTPFAHAFMSFRIKAPIFVARQLVKHQVGLAWNEVSRRYVSDEPEFYFPDEWRGKPINAKQGSDGIVELDKNFPEFSVRTALAHYQTMIDAGVAPEQARMVLPLNSMTEWIWSGSLAAFARVVKLRTDAHAQSETRDIAFMMDVAIPKEFKHSWNALTKENK